MNFFGNLSSPNSSPQTKNSNSVPTDLSIVLGEKIGSLSEKIENLEKNQRIHSNKLKKEQVKIANRMSRIYCIGPIMALGISFVFFNLDNIKNFISFLNKILNGQQ